MDARLLELLVCPLCKGPLEMQRAPDELVCRADRLAFAVRDGMALMLESEARSLDAPPAAPQR
ncbi:MAG TPA: Trm112 family protein [Burkholderiaceae bacterium]|nr:Trm112 family protein [Burkholderiaceae bacterium]